ncbi:hypothetical protein PCANC_02244 [Puccinia coronata f. sp. avenae]|uniref:Retrotransposon gag domain-containing protein n=1 Tax=Puccinia coronata f. sp. avenae TaxID=200324 RepID=A0A2N5W0U9_9BASI|nr:hypothetical protein PCASD_18270 [Puccinia coronata f. sp. avenae]PLW31141.1 hypothetical protein PCASD_12429 [Puccinia coronata f. sp. avenae]PLW55874.1 hypothetical protein PCANC_02244 [Puccinia coronata f. sp. avenae]
MLSGLSEAAAARGSSRSSNALDMWLSGGVILDFHDPVNPLKWWIQQKRAGNTHGSLVHMALDVLSCPGGAGYWVWVKKVGRYPCPLGHSLPAILPNNRSKVVFALSYLTRVSSAWAQPFTQRVFTGNEVTYEKFTVAFQAMYFDTKKKSRAEKALHALKQTKSVAAYTHAFMIYVHNCGWEARILVSQYTEGLHKDICLA